MNIIGTGLTGLVGSRIVELLSPQYSFENISRRTGIDIQDREALAKKIAESSALIVLHLAAKTDVDGCEKDRDEAWAVNVVGTKNVVAACEQTGKKLIYVSTDFVFDGENPPQEGYSEEDIPHPVNWYGQTKFEGEKIVEKSSIPWVIVRIAYPYRSSFEKKDFARVMIESLKNNQPISAITNLLITPTFIDDIAQAINEVIIRNITGIVHITGSQFISPYAIAELIARQFGFSQSLISKTTREKFFANKAPRPFYSIMRNDKIEKLGVKMHTFEEGLKIIIRQIERE